jgi:hypothetical protein
MNTEEQIADTKARRARAHITCANGHSPTNEAGLCLTCYLSAYCYPCGAPLKVDRPPDKFGIQMQVCSKCARYN